MLFPQPPRSRDRVLACPYDFHLHLRLQQPGHISTVVIADGRPRTVTFVTDNDNEILRRDEADGHSSGDPHEIHWYFNGIPVGDVTNNGPSSVNYAQSIAQHITPPSGSGGDVFENSGNCMLPTTTTTRSFRSELFRLEAL